jgi:hypothetical protein
MKFGRTLPRVSDEETDSDGGSSLAKLARMAENTPEGEGYSPLDKSMHLAAGENVLNAIKDGDAAGFMKHLKHAMDLHNKPVGEGEEGE